jgi:hypothetical protein
MKKLRLNTDTFQVEPFEVESARTESGTVVGNDVSGAACPTGVQYSCNYPPTCGGTSCDSGYPVCDQCSARCVTS